MLSLARNALVVIVGTILAYCLREYEPFKITGDVRGGFPHVQPPPFHTSFNGTNFTFPDMITDYGTSLVFIPIVAILEAISIAKAFSKGCQLSKKNSLDFCFSSRAAIGRNPRDDSSRFM